MKLLKTTDLVAWIPPLIKVSNFALNPSDESLQTKDNKVRDKLKKWNGKEPRTRDEQEKTIEG
ncbi:MAG: hypothetical protein ACJA0Q_001095 [Saprospiraceae bacterium]|jgi:hypothetical protein